MRKKLWWKILLPLIIMAKIVVVILLISAAVSDKPVTEVIGKTEFKSLEIPKEVTFAGETMPLERFDVKESLDRELLSNAYFHSQTIRFIKLAPRYFAVIGPILKEKGIPDDFKYLALAESNLNPRAVSPASAVGMWQFLKGTAQQYGLEVGLEVDERYHVEKSTYAACAYFKDSYKKYGNWTLVAASYNAGLAGIDRQLERQKTNSYYDLLLVEETGRYLYRIAALKLILQNPDEYNFVVHNDEKYPVIKTKDVEISGAVANLTDFAKEHGISYKWLKDFNPWLRENFLSNASGKKYVVKIPVID